MPTINKSFLSLTAGDLMSEQVIVLTQEMPLQEAARRLLENQIGGAPVVDGWGKCVGVLSAADFVRLAGQSHAAAPARSVSCSQPHSVLADWQVVEVEQLPAGAVRHYMTADPVTVQADIPIRSLARQMIDAHIHRLIVVDAGERPVGVVSSSDILSAVAYAPEVKSQQSENCLTSDF